MKLDISKPYFLYVGSAYPHKNLGRLMEAVALLNKNLEKPVVLKISSSRSVFTKRLEAIKNEYVELLGFVPDKDLGSLYKNSVAFVFPSLSEGFGLPGIEAMRAGTLVLASDIPVFREVYKDAAIYFDPLDPASIKACIDDVLEMDKEERKKKISYAKNFVKRYSWSQMAKETLKVYRGVLGSA